MSPFIYAVYYVTLEIIPFALLLLTHRKLPLRRPQRARLPEMRALLTVSDSEDGASSYASEDVESGADEPVFPIPEGER